jgi:hypothetical protein
MQAARVPISNYGYRCPQCEIVMRLASILPRWQDLKRAPLLLPNRLHLTAAV